jgi:uncharacterized membrane protein
VFVIGIYFYWHGSCTYNGKGNANKLTGGQHMDEIKRKYLAGEITEEERDEMERQERINQMIEWLKTSRLA